MSSFRAPLPIRTRRKRRSGTSLSEGVCHVTTSHAPGDTRILLRECASLASAGLEVDLLVVASEGSCVAELSESTGVNIAVKEFKVRGRLPRLVMRPFFGVVVGIRSGRRVVHLHDPEMVLAIPVFKLAGRSVVYDAHEDVPRQIESKAWIPSMARQLVSRGFETVENSCVRFADLVVGATDAIAGRFEVIHANVCRARNYALIERFTTPIPIADRMWDVCFVGAINQIRGIDQMIAVVERCGAEVIFAGPCQTAEIDSRLRELEARVEGFTYSGAVPYDQAVEIMRQSRLGLLLYQPEPNHVAAQPNKLYEYMAAGTPVLGSNFPLWIEQIQSNGAGLVVDPTSEDLVVNAVNDLLGDIPGLQDLATQGRGTFEEVFSWEAERESLFEAYRTLIEFPDQIGAD